MNKQRRERIRRLVDNMRTLENELSDILNEEQDYYDNIPENLLSSDRAVDSEEAIDNLEDALDYITQVIDAIESI